MINSFLRCDSGVSHISNLGKYINKLTQAYMIVHVFFTHVRILHHVYIAASMWYDIFLPNPPLPYVIMHL